MRGRLSRCRWAQAGPGSLATVLRPVGNPVDSLGSATFGPHGPSDPQQAVAGGSGCAGGAGPVSGDPQRLRTHQRASLRFDHAQRRCVNVRDAAVTVACVVLRCAKPALRLLALRLRRDCASPTTCTVIDRRDAAGLAASTVIERRGVAAGSGAASDAPACIEECGRTATVGARATADLPVAAVDGLRLLRQCGGRYEQRQSDGDEVLAGHPVALPTALQVVKHFVADCHGTETARPDALAMFRHPVACGLWVSRTVHNKPPPANE